MIDEALNNPLLIDQRTKKDLKDNIPQLKVIVSNLTDSAVELKMAVWSKNNGDSVNLLAELRENLKKRFDSEGIEIPYPYQNIIIKK